MAHRVLLAGRDRSLVESYRAFLTQEGYSMVCATTGAELVYQLRVSAPFDIFVLEPTLLFGRGHDYLINMIEESDLACVPVILLPGGPAGGTDPGLSAAPIRREFQKSPSPAELLSAICEINAESSGAGLALRTGSAQLDDR